MLSRYIKTHKGQLRPKQSKIGNVELADSSFWEMPGKHWEQQLTRKLLLSASIYVSVDDREKLEASTRVLDKQLMDFVYGELKSKILKMVHTDMMSELSYDQYSKLAQGIHTIFEDYSV